MLKVGNDQKFYYNTGTFGSPTWVLVCIVGDVSLDVNINAAEVDLRCSNWLLDLPAKIKGSVNLTIANDVGNATFDTMRGYAYGRTIFEIAMADGLIATPGTQFFRAQSFFTAFPQNEPTQEVVDGDATLAFAWQGATGQQQEPSWTTVPAP